MLKYLANVKKIVVFFFHFHWKFGQLEFAFELKSDKPLQMRQQINGKQKDTLALQSDSLSLFLFFVTLTIF